MRVEGDRKLHRLAPRYVDCGVIQKEWSVCHGDRVDGKMGRVDELDDLRQVSNGCRERMIVQEAQLLWLTIHGWDSHLSPAERTHSFVNSI